MASDKFDRFIEKYEKYERCLGGCVGLCFFIMLFLITVDVSSRWIFNRPLEGTVEISEGLLTICIFMGASYTQFVRGNIRVTLLSAHFPDTLAKVFLGIVYALGFVYFAFVAYNMFLFGWQSWLVRETKWGVIRYPLYPVKFLAAFGCVLLALQFAVDLVRQVRHPAVTEASSHMD